MLDMAGNVWEWCGDWWADSYTSGAKTDPSGPSTGVSRVFRGGSWFISDADGFRCANRYRGTPDGRDGNSVFVCLPQDCAEFLGFNGAKRL
jgi:formylglycine-generating enzyme required for sulfatase activity